MPLRTDIKKVLVIGSGPIVIGQAAEFDYAGTQACRALKEEGLEAVSYTHLYLAASLDKSISYKSKTSSCLTIAEQSVKVLRIKFTSKKRREYR